MNGRRAALTGAVAALALGAGAAQAPAAPGRIDPGFGGGGGLATTPFGLGARAAAVALAPDGRIVVAGDQRGAGGEGALTARLTAAGALDASFAGSGGRIDKFGSGATPQRAGAVAVQADGATIIAGVAGDNWSLARFLPSGLTDGLFGAAGVTLRDPSPGDGPDEEYPYEEPALPDGTGPAAIAIAASGQIVVAGNVGVANDDGVPGEQIVVARFGPTGVPDPAFGRDGFALLQLGFGSAVRHASSAARALSLLPDGRILLAGRASARDGGDRAFVARLSTAGRLDTSFARQGRLLLQLGRASAARVASSALEALVQRPDGRLLAAGRATDVAGGRATLLAGFTAARRARRRVRPPRQRRLAARRRRRRGRRAGIACAGAGARAGRLRGRRRRRQRRLAGRALRPARQPRLRLRQPRPRRLVRRGALRSRRRRGVRGGAAARRQRCSWPAGAPAAACCSGACSAARRARGRRRRRRGS